MKATQEMIDSYNRGKKNYKGVNSMNKCVECGKETDRLVDINGEMVYVCQDGICDLEYQYKKEFGNKVEDVQ